MSAPIRATFAIAFYHGYLGPEQVYLVESGKGYRWIKTNGMTCDGLRHAISLPRAIAWAKKHAFFSCVAEI